MNLKSILVAAFVSLAGMSMPATADHGHGDEKAAKDAVAGVGVINSINKKERKVNISHEPIKAIGWPAMKMDLKVGKGIDLDHVKAGETVDFKIAKGEDGIYQIVDLHHRHEAKK